MRTYNSTSAGKWIALSISFLTTVIMFISYVGYSPLVSEIMDDLQIGYVEAGWLASISTIAAGVIVLFAGALIDKYGPRLLIIASLGVLVIGQVIAAVAPSYTALLWARIILGVGIGLLLVAPYTMAMRWFEPSGRHGLAMGVMLSTDGIGAAFGVYLWASSTAALGWRMQSWLGAGVIALTMIVTTILLREPPRFATDTSQRFSLRNVVQDYLLVLKDRRVWNAVLFLTGIWGPYSIGAFWLPTILVEDAGWSEPTSGLVASLYALAGVITGVVFGLVSDRMGKRRPFILVSGATTSAAFIAIALLLQSSNYLLFALMLPVAGLCAYIGLPLTYVLAADSVGIRHAAKANGIIVGLGFLAGATVFPLLLGASKDLTGTYTMGFFAVAAAQVVCNLIAPLFLARDVRRGRDLSQPQTHVSLAQQR